MNKGISVILGNGQVANAIKSYIQHDEIFDKGEWENLPQTETEILHVTIPFDKIFNHVLNNAINVFDPEVIVIHSTVEPGTSQRFGALYSPVMGRHENNFKVDVLNYRKMVAGDPYLFNKFRTKTSFDVLYTGTNTEELEFAKIMSTGYFFWNLIFEKTIHKICNQRGYDYNVVYKEWNKNYNDGVKESWKRPIYDHVDDPLPAGHCLCPNAYLDDNFINQLLREWIEKKGEIWMVGH